MHEVLRFQPLPPEAVTALLDRTRGAVRDGEYEKFKTSQMFDETNKHPCWLTRAKL